MFNLMKGRGGFKTQQSLGIPLPLWWLVLLQDLPLTILDIWPFISLHAFSSSITLLCIFCRFRRSCSFSSKISGEAVLDSTHASFLGVSLGSIWFCTLVLIWSLDCCEANAWTASPGGILRFFAKSLHASRLIFSKFRHRQRLVRSSADRVGCD